MKPHTLLVIITVIFARVAGYAATEPLRFEAEDWSSPTHAWQKDKYSNDRWNLWSTDKDADKKWSGGVVLQSPRVMKDRVTPEEGAPPLHTRVTGIPNGTYDVELKTGRTLAVSLDGESWRPFTGGFLLEEHVISDGVLDFWVDDRYAHSGNPGSGYFDFITLHPCREVVQKPKVEGWAKTRVEERLDRGVVALATDKGVYVGWRLRQNDPENVVFNVYRQEEGSAEPVRLNASPVCRTTDFVDPNPPKGKTVTYSVRTVVDGLETAGAGGCDTVADAGKPQPYRCIKLDGDHTFQKCAVADLNGDARHDFVIKQPNSNIDPWHKYWKPSPDSYKLEAYAHDGTFLWRRDLGWAIERGIWYSPYVVHDLDGDGAAEVAVKIGEDDPRDDDGKVRSGPEWLAIWDGRTGKEVARTPWPSREGFDGDRGYNLASRNQVAVGYLDGKTPCVIALRGTYTIMKAEAYALTDGKLRQLWTYDDSEGGRKYRGQGAHSTHCADIDGDGRDEVILGSAVIDDNGSPLWTTGLGHPDHFYVGDLDPNRAGLEIYYGIETRRTRNGMCMVDAKTGTILWGFDQPTKHIHSVGLCADIDAASPGCEAYGADSADHKRAGDPWLWSADGKLLTRKIDFGFGIPVVHWDADIQRELVHKGRIRNYPAMDELLKIDGKVVQVADVLGDWREELIVSSKGELRIYSTTIPAENRRVCLMQDPSYRRCVTMGTMGYTRCPVTSYGF